MESFENEMGNINNAVWEVRADEFCSGGEVIRDDQRASLWQVIEQFRSCLLYTSRCV